MKPPRPDPSTGGPKGWNREREEILARQKELGIVPPDTELAPFDKTVKPWDTLSDDERRLFARMQEVYAGFMDHTDLHIGRSLDFLEGIEQMENTLTSEIDVPHRVVTAGPRVTPPDQRDCSAPQDGTYRGSCFSDTSCSRSIERQAGGTPAGYPR